MAQAFLDYQSSTPLLAEAMEAMRPFFADEFGSAASFHKHGIRARDALAKAREQVAAFIGAASAEEILFTSGATESANLAVKGIAWASHRRGNHIVLGATEHPAITASVEFLEKNGFAATRVGVDSEGRIDPAAIRAALTDQTILVCIHHANHDLGTIQRVREISDVTAERSIPLFVDASASGGWLPINVDDLGANLLSLAPHRFYGPKGVGVLYRNRRVRLGSLIHGGVQEAGFRAGTENVPAIVGAGIASEIATREMDQRRAHTAALQQRLWIGLHAQVPYVRLNGPPPGPERSSTNLNVSFEFIEGEGLALALDMQGVSVATGAACVSKAIRVPPALAAIGLDASLARGNILMSLGRDSTEQEVDYAIEIIAKVVQRLRGMSPAWDEFERGLTDSLITPRHT